MSDRTLRWWCAAAAAVVVAFAAYVSLVPFGFSRIPDRTALVELLETSLELRLRSRGNFAANSVMFVPFGFFAAGALIGDRARAARWLATVVVVGVASVLLSVIIEALQVFVPGRTPSLTDVYAQAIGTAVGLAGWRLLGRDARRLFGTYATGHRGALETALLGYALIQVFLLLEPFRVSVDLGWLASKYRAGGIVFNPLHSPTLNWELLPAMLADFLLAAPVGALAVVGGTGRTARRSAAMALLLGAAFFTAGELAQVFVRGRTADVVDLSANLLGMSAGVFAAVGLVDRARAGRAADGPSSLLIPVGLVLAAMLYAGYNLSPFDFAFSRERALAGLDELARVPFHGYYQNPEFKALRDALTKISLGLPFGLLFQVWFRPDRQASGRMLTVVWLALAGGFFLAVEMGQMFVRGRFPDNTDVLLALGGVWVGIVATRPFGRTVREPDAARQLSDRPHGRLQRQAARTER
jgi:VanZ family protein